MTDWSFRFRLESAPGATVDGCGMVDHDITILAREQGEEDWVEVPDRQITIRVHASNLTTMLDMDAGAPKVAAYKNLLVANLDTVGEAVAGCYLMQLEALMNANALAAFEAARVDTYILSVVESYPVEFSI